MNTKHLELCSSAEWADAVKRWIIPWVLEGVDLLSLIHIYDRPPQLSRSQGGHRQQHHDGDNSDDEHLMRERRVKRRHDHGVVGLKGPPHPRQLLIASQAWTVRDVYKRQERMRRCRVRTGSDRRRR